MSVTRMFLDASGSSPLTNRVADALRAGFADGWADPVQLYSESRKARGLLDGARAAIADVIGAQPEYVHFTPSVNLAFERAIGGVFAARRGRDKIVASAIERDAVLDTSAHVSNNNVAIVPVDADGHLDREAFAEHLSNPAVALAAVQYANQEIGTVQRLGGIERIAHDASVPLVVDATASIGHIEAPLEWSALVANPADWGGPAGIGITAFRPQTRWLQSWPGADPWPLAGISVPLALASAVALQERMEERARTASRLARYVDRIRAALYELEGAATVGDRVERLPHVLTAAFMYLDGEPLVTALDRAGISVGSGSACGSDTFEPSHVLAAMGALTHGNIRVGLHPGVTDGDIDRFVETLAQVVDSVKSQMGVYGS